MTNAFASSGLSDQCNAFLSSAVWLDRDAAPLRLLSALARLDVDPWEAAAELSELSERSACTKLASMLASLAGCPTNAGDLEAICARSVRLLPQVKSVKERVPLHTFSRARFFFASRGHE